MGKFRKLFKRLFRHTGLSARLGNLESKEVQDDSLQTNVSKQATESVEIDLILGLDFGTSSTKVVVRSPYGPQSRAIAVPWFGIDGKRTYLLPTALYEDLNGSFSLVRSEQPHQFHRGLKILLMDDIGSSYNRALTAIYLGLVLQSAKRWVLDHERDLHGGFRIRWAVNIGIPSAGYDDTSVRDAFRTVAQAAWLLSQSSSLPTLPIAKDAFGLEIERDSAVPIEVIPEIAAEVVGYARSRRRTNGLHMMVDVGASTLDICGFILHRYDDDDRYELLTAMVKRLGVYSLHRKRIKEIERFGESLQISEALNPNAVIPEVADSYVVDLSPSLRKKLRHIDENYVYECHQSIMKVLRDLRQRRYPASPDWNSGLPVFVAGGGGRFPLVQRAIDHADQRFKHLTVTKGGIERRKLAALETLSNDDISNGLADRLAVAYGLSFDALDIGTITPPGQIEDVPPKRQRDVANPPSKDDV